MFSLQPFSMAAKAIRTNKVRAALTMLGVIIGVMSVVTLIAIAQGASVRISEAIQGMGTNLLTVNITTRRVGQWGGPDRQSGNQAASGGIQRGAVVLTLENILALADSPSIDLVSPTVSGSKTVKAGNINESVNVMGVLPAYAQIRNQSVQSGRYIIQADVDNRSAVCVIGTETARNLYGNVNVAGNILRIDGRPFKIVGVLESKGSSAGASSDDIVILPFSLAQRLLVAPGITSFNVSATAPETVSEAQAYVENYLFKRYQNTSSYRVMNQTELLETVSQQTESMTLMLGGIAAISLLVGGIGIMNIMLVSVTERTREIGIRKAVGAKRRDILMQFLIEALVLSGMGGLLGLGLGLLLMRFLEATQGMTLVLTAGVVELAIGFSMAVGVIFGLYPAGKASKLRPIDALRYD